MPSCPTAPQARKSPARFLTLAGLVVAGILAGGAAWQLHRNQGPAEPPRIDLEGEAGLYSVPPAGRSVTAALEAEVAPASHRRQVEVRRGDTLMNLLVEAGVERRDAHKAITALTKVFKPRDLRPGQALKLAFAATGGATAGADSAVQEQLVAFTLQPGIDREVHVTRQASDGDFLATALDRPLLQQYSAADGTIVSSLFIAGRQSGVPDQVMIELIRAFSFDVDFQREIQADDGFEVLYERFSDVGGQLAKTGDILYAALTLSGRRLALYRYTPSSGRSDYFDVSGQSVRKTLMRTPIDGARVSSGYGKRRHPILGYTKMHRGTDFSAPSGTPIYAAGDGTLEHAGRNGAYGNYIRIRHNGTYKTAYAHMRRLAKGMRRGKRVQQGQVIGYVGSTGRSTGPHLHYEVHVNGRQVNPRKIKLPSGEKLKGPDLEEFQAARAAIERLYERALDSTIMADAGCDPRQAVPEPQGKGMAPAGSAC
jgi:murein DD-endopeptidase MepM/ murein hydrolase activator NlpD